MNIIKHVLRKIANTLVVYGYHLEKDGLVNGKAGVMLFLYEYAHYSGERLYSDYADRMLDGMMRAVPTFTPDFEDGLPGVGWIVNRLLYRHLLDGNPDKVLGNIDRAVFAQMVCDPAVSVLGPAVYLTGRLKHCADPDSFAGMISETLEFIDKGLISYRGKFSLYHTNSLLHFILNVPMVVVHPDRLRRTINLVAMLAVRLHTDGAQDITDAIVYRRLIDGLHGASLSTDIEFPDVQCRDDGQKLTVRQFIRAGWQQIVYFGNVTMPRLSEDEMSCFVEECQQGIQMADFAVDEGLAGLGLVLINGLDND